MNVHVLDDLTDRRSANLRDILAYVRAASPLYRRKLAHVGLEGFRGLEDIAALPYTTRGELLALAPFGAVVPGTKNCGR